MQSKAYLLAFFICILLMSCSSSEAPESSQRSTSTAVQDEQEDPGEYGPGLGEVHVVRSLSIKVSGGLNETITGAQADGETTLGGECRPDMFANLTFDTGSMMSDSAGVAFVTVDPITAGQTGDIDLDWVMFTQNKVGNNEFISMRFMNNEEGGTLKLTTHNTARGSRRFTGLIRATNLQPLDGLESPPIDVEASFDADFSCGIK